MSEQPTNSSAPETTPTDLHWWAAGVAPNEGENVSVSRKLLSEWAHDTERWKLAVLRIAQAHDSVPASALRELAREAVHGKR